MPNQSPKRKRAGYSAPSDQRPKRKRGTTSSPTGPPAPSARVRSGNALTQSIRDAVPAVRTGRRVLLRFPVESDRAEFVALRRASRAHLKPWEPRPPPGFDAWGDDAFDRLIRTCRTDTDNRLLIIERETARIAGVISTTAIVRGPLQSANLGYWIGAAFTGRGLMTEALALAVRHAFQMLRLHRLEANIQPHNTASKRLVRRLGFRREGYSIRFLKIAGRWVDHERWAITVDEPIAASRSHS